MFITNFKPEEFLKTSHEPYLSHRPSTNLLNTMLQDELSRSSICKSFIESIKPNPPKSLSSKLHLQLAMECIGYSFALPAEESALISSSLLIYKDWFVQGPSTPPAFKLKSAFYQREIIGHVSLAFRKRENLSKHEKICKEVIEFFKYIIKLELSQELWETILLTLIIATDQVITNNVKLAEQVSSSLIKVLLEALLRSKSHNKTLWTCLKKKINSWIDCKPVINHWSSVTQSLTKSVSSLIYGEKTSEIEVVFDPSAGCSELLRIFLNDEEKVYFWIRLTELIIVETRSSAKMNPEIHSVLAGSVANIIEHFLAVCRRRVEARPLPAYDSDTNSQTACLRDLLADFSQSHKKYLKRLCRLPMPSINGLMDLYGSWLFYHAQIDPAYDSFGKSETLSILCKIFSYAQGPATSAYSTTFFTTLLSNICDGDKYVVGEILKNSTEIVTYGVEAIDFLLRPDGFIQHLALYLCDKETEAALKLPCYCILSSIVVLPNVYRVRQISKNIVDIFVTAIAIEADNWNFAVLVWSMSAFASCLVDDQDSVQRIICALMDKLEKIEYREKDKEKFVNLIEVVSVLPYLICRKLVAPQIVKRSVEKLQSVVPKRGKSVDDFQTCSVLMAIGNWVECFPVAMMNYELKFELLKSLENRRKQYKNSVLFILGNLINTLAPRLQFNTGSYLSRVLPRAAHNSPLYLYNNTLLSTSGSNNNTELVLRNPCGTFSWKLRVILDPPSQSHQEINLSPLLDSRPLLKQKCSSKRERLLTQDLPEDLQSLQKSFNALYCTQKNRANYLNTCEKSIKALASPLGETQPELSRMLIGQLGFLDPENIQEVLLIENDCLKHIEELDAVGDKEQVVFKIYYVENPEDQESVIGSYLRYSQEFKDFVAGLGMKLMKNSNFNHFEKFLQGFDQVVFRNYELFESFVYLPEFMEVGREKKIKEMMMEDSVCVIWNQKFSDRHSKKRPEVLAAIELEKIVVILLNVVTERLTRVTIEGKQKLKGPLLNQMVVPNEVLPKLLAFTVYNYKSNESSRELQYILKKAQIKDLRLNSAKTISPMDLFSSLQK